MSSSVTQANTLTDEQERAMAAIDAFMVDPRRYMFSVHGLAGTGKTTLLLHVAEQYEPNTLCSPTGNAASELRRRSGLHACTLHSYFYRPITESGDETTRFLPKFHDGALSGGLVLIDESSMIPATIGRALLMTGAKIIACGDPGQLPPVKGAPYFDWADVTLTEICRQRLNSSIIRQAYAVHCGHPYAADGSCFRVAHTSTDDDLRDADVVLCWTDKERLRMNGLCRRVRGFDQPRPQPSEPLVCLHNAPQFGVFNGATYTLLRPFLEGDTSITLNVDGVAVTIPQVQFSGFSHHLRADVRPTTVFDFGYAMTVHKAQGSKWKSVVLIDDCPEWAQRRRWLYTGITRATGCILVVCDQHASRC